jgi:hypothetical protein
MKSETSFSKNPPSHALPQNGFAIRLGGTGLYAYRDYLQIMIANHDSLLYTLSPADSSTLHRIATGSSHAAGKAEAVLALLYGFDQEHEILKLPPDPQYRLAQEADTLPQTVSILDADTGVVMKFTIYPNPNKGSLNIRFETKPCWAKIILYDMLGKQQFEYVIPEENNSAEIDISALHNGTYLYKVSCVATPQYEKIGKLVLIK